MLQLKNQIVISNNGKKIMVIDDARLLSNGLYLVKKNDKCNFIDNSGNIMSKIWFDAFEWFYDGIAHVVLNSKHKLKHNFINEQAKIMSKTWFDYLGMFSDGWARVEKEGKYNFVNYKGKLMNETGFEYADDFEHGFAIIKNHGEIYRINVEGDRA